MSRPHLPIGNPLCFFSSFLRLATKKMATSPPMALTTITISTMLTMAATPPLLGPKELPCATEDPPSLVAVEDPLTTVTPGHKGVVGREDVLSVSALFVYAAVMTGGVGLENGEKEMKEEEEEE